MDGETIINQKDYFKYAEADKEPTQNSIGGGYYQCYCTKFSNMMVFKKKLADKMDKKNKNEPAKLLSVETLLLEDDEAEQKQKTYELCYDF